MTRLGNFITHWRRGDQWAHRSFGEEYVERHGKEHPAVGLQAAEVHDRMLTVQRLYANKSKSNRTEGTRK